MFACISLAKLLPAQLAELQERVRKAELRVQEAEASRAAAELAAQDAEASRAAAAERVAELEQREAPTPFLDYIRNAEDNLYATFYIEPDSEKTSTGSTTRVIGKFYPQRFRPWADFRARHSETFDAFVAAYADTATFPSLTDVLGVRRDLSPDGRADEMDLRPFIRVSIERPAARIVSGYLRYLPRPNATSVHFRNSAYGIQPVEAAPEQNPADGDDVATAPTSRLDGTAGEPPAKRHSPMMAPGVPDRWGIAVAQDGSRTHILVGEYKAAHKLTAKMLRRVMSAPPSEDFFMQAIVKKRATLAKKTAGSAQSPLGSNAGSGSAATNRPQSALVAGHISVAEIMCQAYHYMISSGLEYGYVASGDGLIFLRVPEDDPLTLYYFWSVFPVAQIRDANARRAANIGARTPQETALAHMASFLLWATESTARPAYWVDSVKLDVKRWPVLYGESDELGALAEIPQFRPPSRDGDDDTDRDNGPSHSGGGQRGGSSNNGGSSSRNQRPARGNPGALKRPYPPGLASRPTDAHIAKALEASPIWRPALPYCTHACLLSLALQLPLDKSCPNAALHRAAGAGDSEMAGQVDDFHLLTAFEVRARIVAQLDASMDLGCESLDKYDLFGSTGTLFKMEVIGFGYTLIAKGVQAAHRQQLRREAAVYEALADFQGRLIPVCLGLVDLVRPYPLRTCACVPHMMLLSYAGVDLCQTKALSLPPDVNLEMEIERTADELAAAGLWDDDEREANMAWNEELCRVMRLDFGQAGVETLRMEPAQATKAGTSPSPSAARTAAAEPPASMRSPLLAKRDFNAANGADNEDTRSLSKRPRAESGGQEESANKGGRF